MNEKKIDIYNYYIREKGLDVPFPQANSIEVVIRSLKYIGDNEISAKELADYINYNDREGKYYIDALRFLGMCEKSESNSKYRLTNKGKYLLIKNNLNELFIKEILKHDLFFKVFDYYVQSGELPSKEQIIAFMNGSIISISGNTLERRASTVLSWVKWIIEVDI